MKLSLQGWFDAITATLKEPDAAAERVFSYRFARSTLLQAVVVLSIINMILLAIVSLITPTSIDGAVHVTPLSLVILIAGSMCILAAAIAKIGRMFGGVGDLDGALTAVVWLQAVGLTLDGAQILLMLLSPLIAVFFGFAALFALAWCTVNFVNVLHGFNSLGKATVTLIVALIGTIIAVVILMALLGITPSGDMT
ncbi:hypothetical protein SAMN04488005_1543 [Yoonia tamlensis]|uniref:Yip1 domain-containing protein n=1 Tax=Yoonia tamlensis TaxID=390270 RepID=A0A1I6GET0_9RHOB|nr:YIP1 family protein [Yoonia tamlensis]SFR40702.1 hypothetical protein SAMN04488005_1543 [Yoonia tamlensis]